MAARLGTTNAARCPRCNKVVYDNERSTYNAKWHKLCFTCKKCHLALKESSFERDGETYCLKCYSDLTVGDPISSKTYICPKCNKEVGATYVSAMNERWHEDHFMCSMKGCGKRLLNTTFYVHDKQPYCQKHYVLLNQPKCESCSKPIIEGQQYDEIDGKMYHAGCLPKVSAAPPPPRAVPVPPPARSAPPPVPPPARVPPPAAPLPRATLPTKTSDEAERRHPPPLPPSRKPLPVGSAAPPMASSSHTPPAAPAKKLPPQPTKECSPEPEDKSKKSSGKCTLKTNFEKLGGSQGGLLDFENWKTRFFALFPSEYKIKYYVVRADGKVGRQSGEICNVHKAKVEMLDRTPDGQLPGFYYFHIQEPMDEKGHIRKMLLRTKVEKDRYDWVNAIEDIIIKSRNV